jgi:probable rRNA maturation factor
MSVEISDEQDIPIDHDRLRSRLQACLDKAGLVDSEVSVLLTGDERMLELNETYRHTPSTTDVLSFPQGDPDTGFVGNLLGDIVISVPVAAAQAEQASIGQNDEIENLARHGLLHLLGHDHETEGWEVWEQALKEIEPDG